MTSIARIYVNQVEVGALPASQYHSVVKQIRSDGRLYVLQGFNFVEVLIRFLLATFRLVPSMWFLVAVILAIWAPEAITEFVASFQKFSPSEVSQGFQRMLLWSVLFNGVALMAHVGFAAGFQPYGYINMIDRAVSRRIREVLEVPAEGELMVTVIDDGKSANEQ